MAFDTELMNSQVQDIMNALVLTLNPQAIKMVEKEEDVPENAIRPIKEYGEHMALCQALALTKRDKKTIFFTKEDHWCWNPLIGLGHVPCEPGTESFETVAKFLGIKDMDKAREFFAKFPRLEYGKYAGMLIAPAQTAAFEPDVILFSCDNNFQLRTAIWGIKNMTGTMLESSFDAIDSCIHSIVTPILNRNYRITLPDPGDQERALADKGEIILTVPIEKLPELHEGLMRMEKYGGGYKGYKLEMKYDFARPPFYNTLYEMWGLDTGKDWDHSKG